MRSRIAVFVAVIQLILFFGHWLLYETLTAFFSPSDPERVWLGVALAILSVSFVTASLLAWRYFNLAVRVLYRIAAVWLGFLNFAFMAACLCWMIWGAVLFTGFHLDRQWTATILFAIALTLASTEFLTLYRFASQRWFVRLPNLPKEWSGRTIGFFSDLHLGHMFGAGSLKRVVSKIMHLKPDIVLIGGDLYDGTKVDAGRLAAPLANLSPPLGVYFIEGNHEEFSDPKISRCHQPNRRACPQQ